MSVYDTSVMESVKRHFKKCDPILFAAIRNDEWQTLLRTHDHFTGLCRIVIGQQVSVKAAASIFLKFTTLFPRKKPTAKRVLALTDAELRSAGLSGSKVASIRDVALQIESKSIVFKNLEQKSDSEIIEMLVAARGIGPWSAEMFLIFYLGRTDIFSSGDYALRVAIQKLYNKRTLPTPEEATRIAHTWSPYRSYACRILWESLSNSTDS